MSHNLPGFENISISKVGEWHGSPSELPDLKTLNIDPATHRFIYQRDVVDVHPEDNIKTISSAGFTACTSIVLRDHITGVHTFSHIQPHVLSFEKHMRGRHIASGEAAMLLGTRSHIPNAAYDLRDGAWGNVKVQVVPFDSGSNWWSCVLDIDAAHMLVARSDPSQDLLCGRVFAPSSRAVEA